MTADGAGLESWARGEHTHEGVTHQTFRKGAGPGVVVISEIPGITPSVLEFAEEVVAQGHTVVLPWLFGTPGAAPSVSAMVRSIAQVCISREFTLLATGRTSPVAGWLRSLARTLHQECGGPGVGAVGMCLTGGFALGMMVRHPRYGLGTVIDVSGLARHRIVTVQFDSGDRQEKFVAAKCPLQPVGVR